jgi:SAM-dependent methyltransferase
VDFAILADANLLKRVALGKRHELRDRHFLRCLARHFRPGAILELGAATGHISAILQEYGYEVTASDVVPQLLRAIESRGLKSALVNATEDIVAQTGRRYPNIFAQNIFPLIRRDGLRSLAALRCIHDALEPSGRFICIGAYPWRRRDADIFFSPREQMEIAQSSGLFRMVRWFPHQVTPPGWYREWNAKLLNALDHKLAWIASTRLVWVLEKIER